MDHPCTLTHDRCADRSLTVVCCVGMIDRCAGHLDLRLLTLRQICRSVPPWIRTCAPRTGPAGAPAGPPGAGSVALVRSAAVERGPSGVRVNAVAPGAVRPPPAAAPPGRGGHPGWAAGSA
ncbi:SDR family oxidoreductase [Streptomyces nojiriensis]|uniref:SDR family oxidoreductase n=1 Tax=Streptomyces nojiriensis TaxID=66374 RepID=UPI0035DFE8C6